MLGLLYNCDRVVLQEQDLALGLVLLCNSDTEMINYQSRAQQLLLCCFDAMVEQRSDRQAVFRA